MARKVGLTAEDVVAAAVAIADVDGLGATTLASVAKRLGVRSPSLYHWFDGAKGLRRALSLHGARVLAAELSASLVDLQGFSALRALADTYRRFAARHPGLYAALLPAPRPGEDDELYDALAESVGVVASVLVGIGVPTPHLIPVIRSLRSMLHGFVVLERDRGFGMPEDIDASFALAVDLWVDGVSSRYLVDGG